MNLAWLLRRTVGIDARLFAGPGGLGWVRNAEFLLKKYGILARHAVKPFQLGRDHATLFGRTLYYNSRYGLADLQRMLVTYAGWLRKLDIGPRCTVIDVGANVGMFAEFIRLQYPESVLHCFEPVPSTYACLERNMGGIPGVHIHNMALGDAAGMARIRFDPAASILSSIADDGNVEVRVGTLDGYLRESSVGTIDLLKIDTEGYEAAVLRGGAEALRRTRYLLIEVQIENERRYSLSSLLSQLSSADYEFQLRFYRNFLDQMEGEMPACDLLMENVRFRGSNAPEPGVRAGA
jgi:FkbM family methyltransferase